MLSSTLMRASCLSSAATMIEGAPGREVRVSAARAATWYCGHLRRDFPSAGLILERFSGVDSRYWKRAGCSARLMSRWSVWRESPLTRVAEPAAPAG
jgi:hypothetical protein